MARKFRDLIDRMPKQRCERIRDRAEAMLIEMALQDLRRSRSLTQEDLAEALGLNQSALSKMEHQQDMYVSTLRRILSAMGGKLKLVAEFPDTEVVINQFDEKWAFVYKKEKRCDPANSFDHHCGDNWDHTAFDSDPAPAGLERPGPVEGLHATRPGGGRLSHPQE